MKINIKKEIKISTQFNWKQVQSLIKSSVGYTGDTGTFTTAVESQIGATTILWEKSLTFNIPLRM